MDTVLPSTSPSRARTAPIARVSATDVDGGTLIERVANAWRVHRVLETPTGHERSVIDLACLSGLSQAEEQIAVGLPDGADLDEPTGLHIATCPGCAAEQTPPRQVRSLRGLAR